MHVGSKRCTPGRFGTTPKKLGGIHVAIPHVERMRDSFSCIEAWRDEICRESELGWGWRGQPRPIHGKSFCQPTPHATHYESQLPGREESEESEAGINLGYLAPVAKLKTLHAPSIVVELLKRARRCAAPRLRRAHAHSPNSAASRPPTLQSLSPRADPCCLCNMLRSSSQNSLGRNL